MGSLLPHFSGHLSPQMTADLRYSLARAGRVSGLFLKRTAGRYGLELLPWPRHQIQLKWRCLTLLILASPTFAWALQAHFRSHSQNSQVAAELSTYFMLLLSPSEHQPPSAESEINLRPGTVCKQGCSLLIVSFPLLLTLCARLMSMGPDLNLLQIQDKNGQTIRVCKLSFSSISNMDFTKSKGYSRAFGSKTVKPDAERALQVLLGTCRGSVLWHFSPCSGLYFWLLSDLVNAALWIQQAQKGELWPVHDTVEKKKHRTDILSFQIIHQKAGLSLVLQGLSGMVFPPENTSSLCTPWSINETSSVYYTNRNYSN